MNQKDNSISLLSQLKSNNALWGFVSFFALVIVPIGFGLPDPYLKISMTVGTSIFIALTVSYFTNQKIAAFTNFEVRDLINNKFPKLLQIEEIGLEKVVYENRMDAVGIDLAESSELYIAMNDGKNFFTNNSKNLSERFKKENRKTVVVLMSPDSESEIILNLKNGKFDKGYYASKIKDATKDYIDFHKGAPATNLLEVRYYNYNISMSIVATENVALIGLYRNSAGKALVPPNLLFKNNGHGGEYANIIKDVKNLITLSSVVFDTAAKVITPETTKNSI